MSLSSPPFLVSGAQTGAQTERQTERQTDGQTNGHTYIEAEQYTGPHTQTDRLSNIGAKTLSENRFTFSY